MRNRVWIKLVMAVLVVGLFFSFSCAKKTVVSDSASIQDQTSMGTSDSASSSNSSDDQMVSEQALAEAKAMAARKRFENQDVHFEYDSSDLSSMAKIIIKEKAEWLQRNPAVAILIEGHCDERGTTDYNLALGERRAIQAKSYLENLGISSARLQIISYGEEKPIDNEKTEKAYRKNRRAHFVIK